MRPLIKGICLGSVLLMVVTAGTLISFLPISKSKRRRLQARFAHAFAPMAARAIALKIDIHGDSSLSTGSLFVSNHLSYVDIVALSGLHPFSFITSVEVQTSGLLGRISSCAGSHFVERRNRDRIQEEILEIQKTLSTGLNVFLFAEGTSTNGEQVLPFKRSLFDAAIAINAPVTPLSLKYEFGDDRDSICWYGAMTFFPHLVNLLKRSQIKLELMVHPAIFQTNQMNRRELADRCHQAVRETIEEAFLTKMNNFLPHGEESAKEDSDVSEFDSVDAPLQG